LVGIKKEPPIQILIKKEKWIRRILKKLTLQPRKTLEGIILGKEEFNSYEGLME